MDEFKELINKFLISFKKIKEYWKKEDSKNLTKEIIILLIYPSFIVMLVLAFIFLILSSFIEFGTHTWILGFFLSFSNLFIIFLLGVFLLFIKIGLEVLMEKNIIIYTTSLVTVLSLYIYIKNGEYNNISFLKYFLEVFLILLSLYFLYLLLSNTFNTQFKLSKNLKKENNSFWGRILIYSLLWLVFTGGLIFVGNIFIYIIK